MDKILKVVAILTVCGVAATITLLGRDSSEDLRPDHGGIEVVNARPFLATVHLVHPLTHTPVTHLNTSVHGPLKSRGRNWDDAGAAMSALSSEMQAETRDAVWAELREAQLKARLLQILRANAPPGQVRCFRTLCEITGALPLSIGNSDINATLQSLQDTEMRNAFLGGTLVGGPTFARDNHDVRYTLYFRRSVL